ncbi:MAG: hypothetical protein R3Y33_06345 [Clostridia bacterium]
MDEIKEIVFTACTSLIVGEIIYYLCPKDKLINSVYALFYTVVIMSAVLGFSSFDFDLENYDIDNRYQEEIDEKIAEYYIFETENEMKNMIEELLSTVNIDVRYITIKIEKVDDYIEINSIEVNLVNKSDIQNATAIINKVFTDVIPVEVTSYE